MDSVFYNNYSRLDLNIRQIGFSSFNHSKRVSQHMSSTGSYSFECIFPIRLGLKYMYLFVYTAVTYTRRRPKYMCVCVSQSLQSSEILQCEVCLGYAHHFAFIRRKRHVNVFLEGICAV